MDIHYCQVWLISTPSQGLALNLVLEVEIWVPGVPMQFEYWRQELETYMQIKPITFWLQYVVMFYIIWT